MVELTTEHGTAALEVPEAGIGRALAHVDLSIEAYMARCRRRIPSFVETNFSLKQTWALQRRSLWLDLICAPINSGWALPHLAIRRAADTLEKLGYSRISRWASYVPPGIKTTYQSQIERIISSDLLEWDRERGSAGLPQGFLRELETFPALRERLGADAFQRSAEGSARKLSELLHQYSSARALVSDIAGTLLTLGLSWCVLGNTSMSLKGIASSVAKRRAHDRAASRFFLGRKLGSAFYNVFPPAVHESSVWTILALLVAGLTVGAMACTIVSDPIRRVLGLHRNRLEALLDEVEKELIVLSHKSIRPLLRG